MSKVKKGYLDKLKTAAIVTLLLVTYQQLSQNQTDNFVDSSSNRFEVVKTNVFSGNLLISR
ncbi:MAG: hypothetical protein QNJ38_15935 [Prochloraceae cyanobacterium]|nr:hypothetical protein [Prochloraceae cyanobacterium]